MTHLHLHSPPIIFGVPGDNNVSVQAIRKFPVELLTLQAVEISWSNFMASSASSSALTKSAELNSVLLTPTKNHQEAISRQAFKSTCSAVALGIFLVLDLAWFVLAYLYAYSFSPVQILEVDIEEYRSTSLIGTFGGNRIKTLIKTSCACPGNVGMWSVCYQLHPTASSSCPPLNVVQMWQR